jgi:antirestriction protein ArdC
MSNTKQTTERRDIYQEITNMIIEVLETKSANLKWQKSWISFRNGEMPRNAESNYAYRNFNSILLSLVADLRKYDYSSWLTFKQIKKLGGNVKKGQKATPILFWELFWFDEKGNRYNSEQIKQFSKAQISNMTTRSFMKYHLVFNISQTVNLPEKFTQKAEVELPMPDFKRNSAAEDLIYKTGAVIEFGGDEAYYSPASDIITMPIPEKFKGVEPYYSVLLHELSHWSGHKNRLDRSLYNQFGSPEYAFEELIAELSSAYLCAELGFDLPITNNAAYIKSWLTKLKSDKTWVIKASSQAERAARFITKKAEAYNENIIA